MLSTYRLLRTKATNVTAPLGTTATAAKATNARTSTAATSLWLTGRCVETRILLRSTRAQLSRERRRSGLWPLRPQKLKATLKGKRSRFAHQNLKHQAPPPLQFLHQVLKYPQLLLSPPPWASKKSPTYLPKDIKTSLKTSKFQGHVRSLTSSTVLHKGRMKLAKQ